MTVYGTAYGADKLADIQLSRSIDGKGFYGVLTQEFSCSVQTNSEFTEGSAVTFNGYMLPTFYISKTASPVNGVCRIVAYDCCKNLDILFDYSNYEQFVDGDEEQVRWYPSSQIIGAIAAQCGFAGGGVSSARRPQMCYADFAGKSCRQILEDTSKLDCGYFACSSENRLVFVPFSRGGTSFELPEENRTEIKLSGRKTISGIVADDEVYGTVYSTGAGWRNCERISGRFTSEELFSGVAAQILSGGSYVYYGWECGSALVNQMFNIGDFIRYEGNMLPVLNAVFRFTALGIIAALSAPPPDTSFSEYQDLYARKLDGCVAYDRVLGVEVNKRTGTALRLEI